MFPDLADSPPAESDARPRFRRQPRRARARGFILLLLGAFSVGARAADYYVATNGNDASPGTIGSPYRTIQKAAGVMVAGDTCFIRAGVYPEQVTPANSGAPGSPIVFRAYANETVTISGADPVTGWTLDTGSVYRAAVGWNLGKNNQVFFNGAMVNEARWPNDSDGDNMTPNGATIGSGSTPGSIFCSAFPAGAVADSWNGAVVWVLAQNKWSSWTAMATSYSPAAKRIDMVPHTSPWVIDWHNPSGGGTFTITGSRYALDSAGEWFFNTNSSTLYLWAPGSVNPNSHAVLVKRRLLAFDFRNRSHIELRNVGIMGATIDLRNATKCLVQGCTIRHFYHSRGGDSISSLPGETPGIYVTGTGNTIRDCTVENGVADGFRLQGWSNAVVNCLIRNIDYIGCYGTPVGLWGIGHLVSHNTIEHCGRDGLQFAGVEHVIAYNAIREVGRMCSDLGAMYQGGNDGGNTHIHHNWVYDNRAAAHPCGIYPDNYSYNYCIYRNIAWNTSDAALRINGPSSFNLVYHNTLVGNTATFTWNINSAAGSLAMNNIAATWNLGAGTAYQSNNTGLNGISSTNCTTFVPVQAVDNGYVIPGVSGAYTGGAPDRGALESGAGTWTPGHDFANPPAAAYARPFMPFQNQLRDACFEYARFDARFGLGQPLAYWVRTDAMQAAVSNWPGFVEHPDTRNSVFANSVTLQGAATDGVAQHVGGLLPGTLYRLRARMKRGTGEEIRFGARDFGGSDTYCAVTATSWTDATTIFRTGATNTTATLYVKKVGSGTAHADDLGVAMEFQPALGAVDAGPDRNIGQNQTVLEGALNLCGTAMTNITWSQIAGPATALLATPSQLLTTATFPVDGIYSFRLMAGSDLQSGSDSVQVTVAIGVVPPIPASGLVTWLAADDPSGNGTSPDEGAALATWADKSGGGRHATQGTSSFRPAFRGGVLNGLPVVRFDGADDSMQVPSIRATAGGVHAFVVSVSSATGGDTWQRLLSAYDALASDDYLAPGWAILRPFNAADGSAVAYPATRTAIGYASGRSLPSLRIGDNGKFPNQSFHGDVAEIVVYDRQLAGSDLAAVTNYLHQKWFVPAAPATTTTTSTSTTSTTSSSSTTSTSTTSTTSTTAAGGRSVPINSLLFWIAADDGDADKRGLLRGAPAPLALRGMAGAIPPLGRSHALVVEPVGFSSPPRPARNVKG